MLGNEKPEALPAVELDLSKLPQGMPKIAGTEVKWEEGTEAYEKTKAFLPADLDEELQKKLSETAVQAFQALKLCDYGRIDFRLAADGALHVLEVNPNPYLHARLRVRHGGEEGRALVRRAGRRDRGPGAGALPERRGVAAPGG